MAKPCCGICTDSNASNGKEIILLTQQRHLDILDRLHLRTIECKVNLLFWYADAPRPMLACCKSAQGPTISQCGSLPEVALAKSAYDLILW